MLSQLSSPTNTPPIPHEKTVYNFNKARLICDSVQNDLVEAASHRDVEAFKFIFLREGGDPFIRPKKGECSPFHTAAMVGCTDLVRYILENCSANKKLDINLREEDCNKTALHFAATNGYVETVTYLLSNGAEPHPLCFNTWTPMHYAAENGHADVIVVLLNYGAYPDIKNETSQTSAHLAAVYDHPLCFQIFVNHYGRRAKRIMGETAGIIRLSVPGLIPEMCKKIAAFAVPPADLDIQDDWDRSPMDWAAETIQSVCGRGWEIVNIDWDDSMVDNFFF